MLNQSLNFLEASLRKGVNKGVILSHLSSYRDAISKDVADLLQERLTSSFVADSDSIVRLIEAQGDALSGAISYAGDMRKLVDFCHKTACSLQDFAPTGDTKPSKLQYRSRNSCHNSLLTATCPSSKRCGSSCRFSPLEYMTACVLFGYHHFLLILFTCFQSAQNSTCLRLMPQKNRSPQTFSSRRSLSWQRRFFRALLAQNIGVRQLQRLR